MAVTRKNANSSPQKEDKRRKKKPVSEAEKYVLFERYVMPHLTSVKTLTVKYTDRYQDVEDNYNFVLAQMFTYIHSYDSSKPIDTWIHIVTKRACFSQNKKRAQRSSIQADMECCSTEALYQHGTANMVDAGFGTLADSLSDDVYDALIQIEPFKLSPFLLFAQGLGIREITQLEWQSGHLDIKNEDIIKSRIFWAKRQLQYLLKTNGKSKTSNSDSQHAQ